MKIQVISNTERFVSLEYSQVYGDTNICFTFIQTGNGFIKVLRKFKVSIIL